MRVDEGTAVETDPALIPLAEAVGGTFPQVFIPVTGAITSLAGLFGPAISLVAAANSVGIAVGANTITFSLASTAATSIFNAATAFHVAGTKVVGPRETGWTAGTGTANKGAFATYAGQIISALYVQAEVQATDDAVKAVSQRVKAIEDALRTHGLIN